MVPGDRPARARGRRSRRRRPRWPASRSNWRRRIRRPTKNAAWSCRRSPAEVFGQIRPAVSCVRRGRFVLVIACASVASLLLARTESRRREFSLRRAIGADESRLVRLMLSESAWVVLLGGTTGTLLAMWAGDALLAISPVQLPSFAAPGLDWRTLFFVVTLGVLITVGIGLSPLRSLRHHSLAQDLREGAVEARGGASGRTLQVIVGAVDAITVTLLVGASLFARSFVALTQFDPGFQSSGVLTMRVQLPVEGRVGRPQGDVPGVQALSCSTTFRAFPGVTNASLSTTIPLGRAPTPFSTRQKGQSGRRDQSSACLRAARVPGIRRTLGCTWSRGVRSSHRSGAIRAMSW